MRSIVVIRRLNQVYFTDRSNCRPNSSLFIISNKMKEAKYGCINVPTKKAM